MSEREEIILPRRVPRQPLPFIVDGGDCGACVISGALGLAIADIYNRVDEACIQKFGQPHSISYGRMRQFLQCNEGRLFAEAILDPPIWLARTGGWDMLFGLPGHMQSMSWLPYVRMALRAGFYGIAGVDTMKAGPTGHGSNHWVMVCGYRQRWEERVGNDGDTWRAGHDEILISNSATSQPAEEWVDVGDFLRNWGGFNCFLVRPFDLKEERS